MNIFRAHRIFLRDLCVKCHTKLSELDGVDRDEQIGRNAELVQEMVDTMCASIPYTFGDDDPAARAVERTVVVPHVEIDFFHHLSFSFPLLVSSMVDSLPAKQKEGIEVARWTCAEMSGL